MQSWLVLLALGAALVAIGVGLARSLHVLDLRVERGTVLRARGRATGELLGELSDVLERSKASGRVLLRIEGGQVRVHAEGLDEGTIQRLRNVVGRFPPARLKQAPRLGSGR